jgi:large subunit ribosomal protein L10
MKPWLNHMTAVVSAGKERGEKMVKQIKINAVESLTDKFRKAKSLILTDYRGMTVQEMTSLRKILRAQQVEFRIVKNRLAKIAIQKAGCESLDEFLTGLTAIAIGYDDPVLPARILNEFIRTSEKLKVKGGLLEGKKIALKTVERLAKMPGKQEILGRLACSLKSPVSMLALSLRQAASKLVYALKAIEDLKKAEVG